MAFFLLYLRTLCPTVYLGDAGEFCAAMVTGGVAHPPGYPLFLLLGRCMLALVPFGEPAFRVGCLVAAAGAGTVALVYCLARELRASPYSALAAAGVFGLNATFWSQSVRVEVYSLHTLLLSLLLLAALRYRRTESRGWLAVAAVAGALGLAHHLTIILAVPALLVMCGKRLVARAGRPQRLFIIGGALCITPALYALLMAWAAGDPLHNWGSPTTLPLLINHASARYYQGYLRVPDTAHLTRALPEALRLLWDSFPYLLLALPLVGAYQVWKAERSVGAALALYAALVTAYSLCYHIPDIAAYYLPVWLIGCVFLGVGVERLAPLMRAPILRVAVAGVCAVLVLRNFGVCDLSGATWVRDFARHKLESADAGSVLVAQGDHDTSPLWYVQDVLKVRPDVVLLDRTLANGIWSDRDPSGWYYRHLQKKGLDLPAWRPRNAAERAYLRDDHYLIGLLEGLLRGRPLSMTFAGPDAAEGTRSHRFLQWVRERRELLPQGIILGLHPKNQPVDLRQLLARNDSLWQRMSLPDLRGVSTDDEMDPNYVPHHYACMLVNYGNLREMAGDRQGAERIYHLATQYAPRYLPAAEALASVQRSVPQRRSEAPAPAGRS